MWMRLSRLLFLPLLLLPILFYGCLGGQRGASVGLVISPDFVTQPEMTLAIRVLHPDRVTETRLVNVAPSLRIPLQEGRDYVADPLRLELVAENDSGQERSIFHIVLFQNSVAEVEAAFAAIENPREQQYLQADAKVNHSAVPDATVDALEELSPVAFATLLLDPTRSSQQTFALLPYDADKGTADADKDTLPQLVASASCSFSNTGEQVSVRQCETFSAMQLALAPFLSVLECNDEDSTQNGFEVDDCGSNGSGVAFDDDCSGSARVSCTPIDNDADGVCSDPSSDELLQDPNAEILCPKGFDDCNDDNSIIFPGAVLDAAACSLQGSVGGLDINCDGSTDFCACDADRDTFCAPLDCNDNDVSVGPGVAEICGNNSDEDCDGVASPCEPADGDGDGQCRATALIYKTKTFAANEPQPEPNVDAASVQQCPDGLIDCNDQDTSVFQGAPERCDDNVDNNCDGVINEGCPANDNDHDGSPAGTDCNDNEPQISPFAKEICGNAVDENCDQNIAACGQLPDADNDAVADDDDCDDTDPEIFPGNGEVCDGKDNDCDGLVDEGNPPLLQDNGGVLALSQNGIPVSCEGVPGVPASYSDDNIPNNLACQQGVSVCSQGVALCIGAIPPKVDVCSGIPVDPRIAVNVNIDPLANIVPNFFFAVDNDCNGQFSTQEVDEDISSQLFGDGALACDDVLTSAVDADCDPDDPNVYPVIASVGAALVAPTHFCDGKPDDCTLLALDETDNDNDGFAECTAQAGPNGSLAPGFKGGDCDDADPARSPGVIEFCDNKDNDCDGQIDEGCDDDNDERCDITIAKAPGVVVAVCPETPVDAAQGDDCDDTKNNVKPGLAEVCDNLNNDCSGNVANDAAQIDNGCDDDNDDFCDATIAKAAGVVVTTCASTPAGATTGNDCNDNDNGVRPNAAERCGSGVDENCTAGDNDGCDDDNDDFCDSSLFVVNAALAGCPISADNTQGNDCNDAQNGVRPNAAERCGSGVDENCTAGDNDGCDDDNDDFCDSSLFVVNSVTAGCALSGNNAQGNDCNDAQNGVRPNAAERCGSGVDENCTAGDNDGCDDDNDDFCDSAQFVVNAAAAGCANSTNNTQGNDCNDAQVAINPNAAERCGSGVDENCTAGDNDGCDDDNDDFCDSSLFVVNAATAGCPNSTNNTQGNDCNDAQNGVRPNAAERCGSGVDENCTAGDNDGCDDDNDDFCDSAQFVVNAAAAGCPNSTNNLQGNDCNDAQTGIRPNAAEICGSGVDENCTAGDNDGCDDDNDDFCDSAFSVVNAVTAGCPLSTNNAQGNDCNDAQNGVRPNAAERCGSGVDENCTAGDNDGCDDDNDGACDSALFVVNKIVAGCQLSSDNSQGTDCDDTKNNVRPGLAEVCDNLDNDCSGGANGVDTGCDDDNDDFCDATIPKTANVAVTTCTQTPAAANVGNDCDDNKNNVNPGAAEICDNLDNDCSGGAAGVDTGCDDDNDDFCDAAIAKAANVAVTTCTQTPAAANVGNDCNDAQVAINPNAAERCGSGADENCTAGDNDGCDDDNDDFCDSTLFVVNAATAGCPNSSNNQQGNDCNDAQIAINPNAAERCGSGVDENCAAGDNDGCDDDNDDFCDSTLFVVNAVVAGCPNSTNNLQGNDCNDGSVAINPNASERCGSGVDENCTAGDNDGCDDDNDDFCDAALFVVNAATAGCPLSTGNSQGNDCIDNNNNINPGAAERCGSGADENCTGGDNDGCDDDNDGFCDASLFVVNANNAGCASSSNNQQGNDCNDNNNAIKPNAVERCGSGVDENCTAGDNDGCDDDNDDFCDSALFVVSANTAGCVNSSNNSQGDDCDDTSNVTFPGAHELCNGVDNDCDGIADAVDAQADAACGVLECILVGGQTTCGCIADNDCKVGNGGSPTCDNNTGLCQCDFNANEQLGQGCNSNNNQAVFTCEVNADCPSNLSCSGIQNGDRFCQ